MILTFAMLTYYILKFLQYAENKCRIYDQDKNMRYFFKKGTSF